jgi:hypothetical protein
MQPIQQSQLLQLHEETLDNWYGIKWKPIYNDREGGNVALINHNDIWLFWGILTW